MLDTNDLTMGIRQAQDDMHSYYILGYYSTNDKEDGKYRRIDVKLVNKELSAKLDFRKGYYAGKTWQKFNANDKERQLEEALTLGDPVNELPLAVEVDYFRVARDRYFVPISVKIPGSAVGLTKKGVKQTANLDFIGQVRDATGKLVSGVRDEITVKLDESNAAKIGQRHLQYDAGLTLFPWRLHAALSGPRKSERQNGDLRDEIHNSGPERDENAAPQLGHLEQSEGGRRLRGRRCWDQ